MRPVGESDGLGWQKVVSSTGRSATPTRWSGELWAFWRSMGWPKSRMSCRSSPTGGDVAVAENGEALGDNGARPRAVGSAIGAGNPA
jgi:hypothetical protein